MTRKFKPSTAFFSVGRSKLLRKMPKDVPIRPVKVDSKLKPVVLKRVKAAT
jgi:hypothetical protein